MSSTENTAESNLPTKQGKRKKGKTKSTRQKNNSKSPERKQKDITDFCSPNSKHANAQETLENSLEKQAEPKSGVSGSVNKTLTTKMVPSPTDIGFLKMSPYVDRKQVKTELNDADSVRNFEKFEAFPSSPQTKGKRNASRTKASKANKYTKP